MALMTRMGGGTDALSRQSMRGGSTGFAPDNRRAREDMPIREIREIGGLWGSVLMLL
jgi:hypothetical protein